MQISRVQTSIKDIKGTMCFVGTWNDPFATVYLVWIAMKISQSCITRKISLNICMSFRFQSPVVCQFLPTSRVCDYTNSEPQVRCFKKLFATTWGWIREMLPVWKGTIVSRVERAPYIFSYEASEGLYMTMGQVGYGGRPISWLDLGVCDPSNWNRDHVYMMDRRGCSIVVLLI